MTIASSRPRSVAVVGMGYVGLPTALALHEAGARTIGLDVSTERLRTITSGEPDLVDADRERLARARHDPGFQLTEDETRLAEADAVIVCVPTPLDDHLSPELSPLRAACRAVVEHARPGQTLILTSTSFVGTTRQLLVEPLADRGFEVGSDIFVAFSPERIDPGRPDHTQQETPRVVGGPTPQCATAARAVLGLLTPMLHEVSSAEAAELTKLYENSFRAVNIALANEFAEICGTLELDPIEITRAAATKPYGFLAFYPGPGVGGHCIPCDPHYLLWQLKAVRVTAPLVTQAMTLISDRPQRVVARTLETLSHAGRGVAGARVVVVGASYKPGVADLRESSALEIIADLLARGAKVDYYDPMVDRLALDGGRVLESVTEPHGTDWDLALVHTTHPGHDYSWVGHCPIVLDATYTFTDAPERALV
ncbi:nucleotide sugar dehydrogenase [Amycolatopsis sp. GM8]|uniref:nucleotide sugar dehydrogenase n=1 Tax=Amycolatopsis sp. GM8 TaxID=2896530 RepID=UPI001F00E12E|nr:nucleotide sugar dehydrogenase [Amycolatopsis sp. GM8]